MSRDAWFESEPRTRIEMVAELQRIKRRTRVRPLPVIAMAALITAGITYKVATKPVVVEAEVVLALAEGTMNNRNNNVLPVEQLRDYVYSILLPDKDLTDLIERRDLFRLRKKLGPEYAIEEMRSKFSIQIWKNSFVYFDEDDAAAKRSARIGITVLDSDADRAYQLAQDLASLAMRNAAVQRQQLAAALSTQVAQLRAGVEDRLAKLTEEIEQKKTAIDEAARRDQPDLAGILQIDLAALDRQQRRTELQLSGIAVSRDALASEITEAGLDMSLAIVSEHRPEQPARAGFVLALVAAVVGTGALVGSALILGAFDSRVHDTDDVARLGLPILGQLPRFPGDNVGSMSTRGVTPTRVPSFIRWRSHR